MLTTLKPLFIHDMTSITIWTQDLPIIMTMETAIKPLPTHHMIIIATAQPLYMCLSCTHMFRIKIINHLLLAQPWSAERSEIKYEGIEGKGL